jgi:hypothetical protein
LKLEIQDKAILGTTYEYLQITIPDSSEHLRKPNVNQLKINNSSEYEKDLKIFHLLFQKKYLSLNLSKEAREVGDDLSKLEIKFIDTEETRIRKPGIFSFLQRIFYLLNF